MQDRTMTGRAGGIEITVTHRREQAGAGESVVVNLVATPGPNGPRRLLEALADQFPFALPLAEAFSGGIFEEQLRRTPWAHPLTGFESSAVTQALAPWAWWLRSGEMAARNWFALFGLNFEDARGAAAATGWQAANEPSAPDGEGKPRVRPGARDVPFTTDG